MAEEAPASRLDNAGVLQQSASSSIIPEKVTILPGHEQDYSACTFSLYNEDHTLGNALRWIIMKDPDVEFCGYSAPHPAEPKIHLRIQMYAVDCLRRGLKNLRDLLNTVNDKYSTSLRLKQTLIIRRDKFIREEDVDFKAVVQETLRQRGFAPAEESDAMDQS